ncbi:hypothetical protein CPHO_03900 [Corynebacterium phocae]|uniref:Uncharacterized protein n=1 Tax=Corynebacterium phocae TaxID=161895 RepID=A0A1L7D254_9CORY|nr:hypothetical protein [Corynebacterium phocae]APT92170.1 hypothetical protein CPHO_03900 [Corynebacterium phocae]KAA8725957.1 hypothetical protein F4V58_03445 [Corynebacterium phocae]
MSRFGTALVAAATALSLTLPLSTAPALAGGYRMPETSSEVRDDDYYYQDWALKKFQNGEVSPALLGWAATHSPNDAAALGSSVKNDYVNDYKFGTTFDILWGTSVAVILLGGLYTWAKDAHIIPS